MPTILLPIQDGTDPHRTDQHLAGIIPFLKKSISLLEDGQLGPPDIRLREIDP
jgi:hypothetical protein